MVSVLLHALKVKFNVMDGVRQFRTISKIVVTAESFAIKMKYVQMVFVLQMNVLNPMLQVLVILYVVLKASLPMLINVQLMQIS